MKTTKKWYESKTVWGSFTALIISILSAIYGETSPAVAILISIASSLGIYGRFNATQKIEL